MLIFKDVISGDELFSDTYKYKLVDNCLYEVVGKLETRKEGEVHLEGSNASAEEADEGTDEAVQSGINIVLNHRLVETGFGSKKDYTTYLKDYMKKIVKHLEESGKKEQVDEFKKNITAVMPGLLGKFKDLQFFTGESMNPDAMIVLCDYREVDGKDDTPVLTFFKHGLDEEKF